MEELDLSNNSLSVVSKRVLDAFPNLIELNVNGNSLTGLQFLEPLRQLQVLRMARNKLRTLEGESRFPEILKLDFQANELQKVGNIAKVFPSVVEVDLSNNRINQESELDFVGDCSLLTTIDTRGNPVWSEELVTRLIRLNPDINEVDGEEVASGATQFQARLAQMGDPDQSETIFDERSEAAGDKLDREAEQEMLAVNRLASQKTSLDIRFREISRRLEAELTQMEEGLTKKKHEIDTETQTCEDFLQKVYKITPKPRPQSSLLTENSSFFSNEPGPRPSTVRSEQLPGGPCPSKPDTTSALHSLEQGKERNFRLKKLKQAVTFHRTPNPRLLQQQTAQLKELFNVK